MAILGTLMAILNLLSGYKTYLAAAGLLALAFYQLSIADYMAAYQSVMAALAAAGLRSAIATAPPRGA